MPPPQSLSDFLQFAVYLLQHLFTAYIAAGFFQQIEKFHPAHHFHQICIAEQLNVSKAYLSNRFRRETSVCLRDYVTSCHMDEAMRLLETSRMPVREIALACGYSNLSYFSKTFRRRKHFSPSAYRFLAGNAEKE